MSKRKPLLYLQDILTSLSRIDDYTKNLSLEDLNNDWKTIDAVVRNLEILGEAARNMPKEVLEKYPDDTLKLITASPNSGAIALGIEVPPPDINYMLRAVRVALGPEINCN